MIACTCPTCARTHLVRAPDRGAWSTIRCCGAVSTVFLGFTLQPRIVGPCGEATPGARLPGGQPLSQPASHGTS